MILSNRSQSSSLSRFHLSALATRSTKNPLNPCLICMSRVFPFVYSRLFRMLRTYSPVSRPYSLHNVMEGKSTSVTGCEVVPHVTTHMCETLFEFSNHVERRDVKICTVGNYLFFVASIMTSTRYFDFPGPPLLCVHTKVHTFFPRRLSVRSPMQMCVYMYMHLAV